MPTVVTLVGKPGCHLCDDARAVVRDVVADYPGIEIDEKSILDDAELHEKYAEKIPVVILGGRVHAVWRVDREKFRSALERVELESSGA